MTSESSMGRVDIVEYDFGENHDTIYQTTPALSGEALIGAREKQYVQVKIAEVLTAVVAFPIVFVLHQVGFYSNSFPVVIIAFTVLYLGVILYVPSRETVIPSVKNTDVQWVDVRDEYSGASVTHLSEVEVSSPPWDVVLKAISSHISIHARAP